MQRLRTRLRNGVSLSPSAALNLNFLSGGLDSRITFTRSTTATFTGSNGLIQTAAINAPRFDYDPVTLAPKGLLIEEQRTNLLTYSEQFDNAFWTKTNTTVTANTTVAPDGTTTADTLTPTTTALQTAHRVYIISPTSSALAQTQSIYVKANGYSQVALRESNATGAAAVFNLSNGTVAGTFNAGTISVSSPTITAMPNGWYRISAVFTASVSTPQSFGLYVLNGAWTSGTVEYAWTGDGTSGIFIWGAQLEAGSFATSYIPTVASQVTRSADIATMTGTNFSSWYNQSEGTLLVAFDTTTLNASGATTYTATASSDGTNSNVNTLHVYSDFAGGAVRTGNVNQADLNAGGSPTNNTTIKSAIAYATNDIAVTANGAVVKTDTSATINTTMTQLGVGTRTLGNPINGHIRSITYYNTRLPNATLQALTA